MHLQRGSFEVASFFLLLEHWSYPISISSNRKKGKLLSNNTTHIFNTRLLLEILVAEGNHILEIQVKNDHIFNFLLLENTVEAMLNNRKDNTHYFKHRLYCFTA